jgi:Secretion system C-terminal sorting domain
LLINSSNGLNITIKGNITSDGEEGIITAHFSSAVKFEIHIWIGKPSFAFVYNYFEQQPIKSTLCVVSNVPNLTLAQQGVTNIKFIGSSIVNSACIRTTNPFCKEAIVTNACGSTTFKYDDCDFNRQSALKNYFYIYPNPSNNIVNIDISDEGNLPNEAAQVSGELYDMMGQIKTKVQIRDNKATFSVRDLNKGIYVLKIYIDNQIETHQIAVE